MEKHKALWILFLILVTLTGCETPGDKFPRFEVGEKQLGEIRNHMILKAAFLNEMVGFVAISIDTILKTTDGCKSFQLSLADTTCSFEEIRFLNVTTGYVLDKNKFLYKTLDGGMTWQKQTLDFPGLMLKDIYCLNSDTLFIVAGGDPQAMFGFVLRSSDGGTTWDTLKIKNLSRFFFPGDHTGFLCGFDGVLKTNDAGLTWDTLSDVPGMEMIFMDSARGYMSFKRVLLSTSDGGRNWQTVRNIKNPRWIMGEDFSKIECLNKLPNGDLVFTLNSRIIRVDAAGKWSQYEFTRPYYQLQMIGPETGIIYGFEKIILVNF